MAGIFFGKELNIVYMLLKRHSRVCGEETNATYLIRNRGWTTVEWT